MIDAPGIFVMGTDTGVGKTVVATSIGLAARANGRTAVPLKPAQTGAPPVGDAEFAAALLGVDEPIEAIRPYDLAAPLAPMVAAGLEGVRLDPRVVADAFAALSASYDLVVVEAAGGALVPFSDGVDMAALAAMLGLPVVVAARPGLGTLNHTLLTLEALHRRGLTPLPLLGAIGEDRDIDVERGRAGRLAELGPAGLDPLLGGTFSPARFRRHAEERLAALEPVHRR